MYVDKKLSGVKAVQTLSRLNRTREGKEDTFVLDFTNDRQDILKSFQPFYEMTMMNETTDPNHLYDLKGKLDASEIYHQSEVEDFAAVFYQPNIAVNAGMQGKLYSSIAPAIDRFKQLPTLEAKDEFKKQIIAFVRLYSFLSQIIPFQDVELEKLYSFGRFLSPKLPQTDYAEQLRLDNDVALEYYRMQKLDDGDLLLQMNGEQALKPTTEAGISREKDEKAKLSDIITILNNRFGTNFNEADKLFFDQLEEEMFQDEDLRKRALNNPHVNFKYAFEDVFINKLIERMESNQEIFEKIMGDSNFSSDVKD